MAAACAAFEHTALRSSLVSWRDTQAPLQPSIHDGGYNPHVVEAAAATRDGGCNPNAMEAAAPPHPHTSSSPQVELRQLQALPELLASTEAFKACEPSP